jgi:hypothetical protein
MLDERWQGYIWNIAVENIVIGNVALEKYPFEI